VIIIYQQKLLSRDLSLKQTGNQWWI